MAASVKEPFKKPRHNHPDDSKGQNRTNQRPPVKSEKGVDLLWVLVLIAAAVFVYTLHMGHSFVDMDLDPYRTILRTDRFLETAQRLITDLNGKVVPGYYSPLSSISLMTDKLFSSSLQEITPITILLNLAFHCLNAALLYLLLLRLGAGPWAVRAAVFLFVLHPLQVPSVLWFAERKTVMACAFFFLAHLGYVRFKLRESSRYYVASIAAFVLGLLCKPTVTVLPVLLLVYEIAGFGRHRSVDSTRTEDRTDSGTSITRKDDVSLPRHRLPSGRMRGLWALVPFFLISLAFGLITLSSEKPSGVPLPLADRPFVVTTAIGFYLLKIIAPFNLMAVYPRWNVNPAAPVWWVPLSLAMAFGAALVLFRRRIPALWWWGISAFVVPLLPVAGIVNFGYFQHAFVGSHLVYISMAGAGLCMGLAIQGLIHISSRSVKPAVMGATLVYFGFIIWVTWSQTALWANPIELWADNARQCPSCWGAWNMLGRGLMESGHSWDAVTYFDRALELKPDEASILLNRGAALDAIGRKKEAGASFARAVELKPRSGKARANLGLFLLKSGKIDESIASFKKAIELDPKLAFAHFNLAHALRLKGDLSRAIKHWKMATELRPGYYEAHGNLGLALREQGRSDEALKYFWHAVAIRPRSAQARLDLGLTLLDLGKPVQAEKEFSRAIGLSPRFAAAHIGLARCLEAQGRFEEALSAYGNALELDPNSAGAKENIARLRKSSPDSGPR